MNLPEDARYEGPLCKYCWKPVDWNNLRYLEREFRPRIYERAYFCPHCRAILEFASWQSGENG